MKFAQEFRKSLQHEGFPQKWVEVAIPYGQLKKLLKKIIGELQALGLDRDTLSQLAHIHNGSHPALHDAGFQYHLDGRASSTGHFRPRLTIFVHIQDGVAVDATLTPATRDFLHKVALKTPGANATPSSLEGRPPADLASTSLVPSKTSGADDDAATARGETSMVQQVEVPLVFDAQFFEILQTDVSNLDTLQAEEQNKLMRQIVALGSEIKKATNPDQGRKAKGDLVKWRDIFELYLDARVFFSTRESDHGARTSTQALEQLQWFQNQVASRKLVNGLKLDASRQAYCRFLEMNATLLQILKFQEINSLAITKILKKFDKRTSLGVSKTFPVVVHSDRLLAGSVARDICAQVSTELIPIVPRLDDFLCPICFAVAYWPVKLHCDHIFCSRCLVKMSRRGERLCPLCRADTIMLASIDNFDAERAAFLRQYFPKEVKEKIRANEKERNAEIFGPEHSEAPCCVM
ncbi:RING-14 protein [Xylariomycetidae sp. FL0641]|nr:RING-14 protein [Xylariomycetidae sp. FL0641]